MKVLIKSILILAVGICLFVMGYALGGDQSFNRFMAIWMCCGIPYGLPRLRSWIMLRNGDLGTTAAIFVLNFILAGLIGGFIYVLTMLKSIISIVSFFLKSNTAPNKESLS